MFSYQRTYMNMKPNTCNGINYRYKRLIVLLSAFFLLVVGLRHREIGNDTWNYINTFNRYSMLSFRSLSGFKWYDEIGYFFSMILFGKLGLTWQYYAVFMAALYIIPLMLLIYEETDNAFFAFTIFIMSGMWTYPMSTMRQAAAIGFVVLAYKNKDSLIKSIILVLIGATFHISALIALLYLVIVHVPLTRKNSIIWVVIGMIIAVLAIGPARDIFFQIMGFFGRDRYVLDESTGGWLQELFFVLTILLGLFVVQDYEDERYVNSLKGIYLAAVLLPIVRINPTLFRAYSYFSLYQIVFVPLLLHKISNPIVKFTGYYGYVGAYLYLFFTQCMVLSLQVIPYKFFWM